MGEKMDHPQCYLRILITPLVSSNSSYLSFVNTYYPLQQINISYISVFTMLKHLATAADFHKTFCTIKYNVWFTLKCVFVPRYSSMMCTTAMWMDCIVLDCKDSTENELFSQSNLAVLSRTQMDGGYIHFLSLYFIWLSMVLVYLCLNQTYNGF